MEQNRGPARLVAPGRIILRELEARGWQQKDLAEIMGRPEQALSEIINDKKQITAETARELASAFGTSADFWMNLEAHYRLRLAERGAQEQDIRRRGQIYAKVPYREVVKRGWIEDRETTEGQAQEVCRLLNISSLDEQPRLAMAARRSARHEPEQTALLAWACRAEDLLARQNVAAPPPAAWEALIGDLLSCATDEAGVVQVPKKLLAMGVGFVIVPHLPLTYLDGAAMWVKGRPAVALTLRYNRLDNFWFTLMHELAHLALGHEGTYLDRLDSERTMTPEEQQADAQAAAWLIDEDAFRAFVARGEFGKAAVLRFAGEVGRHPSTIAGRLQHDDAELYKRLASLHVPVRRYLEEWIDAPVTA